MSKETYPILAQQDWLKAYISEAKVPKQLPIMLKQ